MNYKSFRSESKDTFNGTRKIYIFLDIVSKHCFWIKGQEVAFFKLNFIFLFFEDLYAFHRKN